MRCLIRLVSMLLPFLRCACGDHFWDLWWKKWYVISGLSELSQWCRLCRWLALSVWVCLSTFAPMAARSSCQLPLAQHITRDCDGLWKDIRRTGLKVGPLFSSAFTAFNPFSQSVRQSVTISLWEVLSLRCQVWSLPPARGRTISGSLCD